MDIFMSQLKNVAIQKRSAQIFIRYSNEFYVSKPQLLYCKWRLQNMYPLDSSLKTTFYEFVLKGK